MRQASISKYFSSPTGIGSKNSNSSTLDSTATKALTTAAVMIPMIEEGHNIVDLTSLSAIDCSADALIVSKLDASSKISRHDFSDIVVEAFNFPLSTQEKSIIDDERKGASMKVSFTPLEKQVEKIRQQYPDSLLMVECGYRMRFFGDDAVVASRVLNIFAHKDHNFMVASIPTHRSVHHCRRLVSAGLKVAIVRQRETAALKKAMKASSSRGSSTSCGNTFDRDVVGVFSVGTMIDEDDPAFMDLNKLFHAKGLSNDDQPDMDEDDEEGDEPRADVDVDVDHNAPDTVELDPSDAWISAIVESGDSHKIGIMSVCVLSNEVKAALLDKDEDRKQLADYLDLLQPVEVIAEQSISSSTRSVLQMRCCEPVLPSASKEVPVAVPAVGSPPSLPFIRRFLTLVDEEFSSPMSNEDKHSIPSWVQELPSSLAKCAYGMRSYLKIFDLSSSLLQSSLQQWTVPPTEKDSSDSSVSACGDRLKTHHFSLDPVTIRDLDIVHVSAPLAPATQTQAAATSKKSSVKDQSSLFWLLNNCCSQLGRRTLRSWLTHPLCSYSDIVQRQDFIGWIAAASNEFNSLLGRRNGSSSSGRENSSNLGLWLKNIIGALKNRTCPDLERLLTSLQHGRISPRKLLQLLKFASGLQFLSAKQLPQLNDTPVLLEEMKIKFLAETEAMLLSVDRLLQVINPTAAAQNCISEVIDYDRADIIVDSKSQVIDIEDEQEPPLHLKPSEDRIRLLQRMRSVEQQLEEELRSIRIAVRNPSLQYKSLRSGPLSSIEGLVEVPITHTHLKIPNDWVETNSTKQLRRYHVPQVVALNDEVQLIRDELDKDARVQWTKMLSLCDKLLQSALRKVCRFLGEMDCLISLAVVSALPGYTRPVYVENGDAIELTNARHPMVERYLERRGGAGHSDYSHTNKDVDSEDSSAAAEFIPNDALLRCNFGDRRCQVVTGPNMGGKSSYVRMVALLCILGQIGSSVPAEGARLCVLDNIFTRMGAGDDLAAGMSTFMNELSRTSNILSQVTCRSLVVLDELGRGTSTNDGVAIALSTLRYIVQKIGCALLFVTHYPQIAEVAQEDSMKDKVVNVYMSYVERPSSETGDDILFLYKVVDGVSSGSYGINVARIAGLGDGLLRLAKERSQWMLERCSLSHAHDDDDGDDDNDVKKKRRISSRDSPHSCDIAVTNYGDSSMEDDEETAYRIWQGMKELLLQWDFDCNPGPVGDSNSSSSSSGGGSGSSGGGSSSGTSSRDNSNDHGRKRAKQSPEFNSVEQLERKFASFLEAAASIVNRSRHT